jgi:hypothetical protein
MISERISERMSERLESTEPALRLERRTSRSSRPEEALHYFLDSARKRLGVDALTVAKDDGELIAGSGDAPGFVAGLAAKIDAGDHVRSDIATWRLAIGDKSYVIASLGARMHEDVGAGVRRILG